MDIITREMHILLQQISVASWVIPLVIILFFGFGPDSLNSLFSETYLGILYPLIQTLKL